MRTWGRMDNEGTWVEVATDDQGNNDSVWLTTLAQTLLLNRGESPFFGDRGIPAQQSVITQLLPDYYVTLTQQQFAPYFASLIINRRPGTGSGANNPPMYDVNVVTNNGVKIPFAITFPI
jgi:hypothetical protein